LAVLATLATSRSHELEHAGRATASALTSGYHLAFWIATALCGAAIAVVGAVPRQRGVGADAAHDRAEAARVAPGAAELGSEAA
jgi:hypothetical protein